MRDCPNYSACETGAGLESDEGNALGSSPHKSLSVEQTKQLSTEQQQFAAVLGQCLVGMWRQESERTAISLENKRIHMTT